MGALPTVMIHWAGLYFLIGWIVSLGIHSYEYWVQRKMITAYQDRVPAGYVLKPMSWSLDRLVVIAIFWPFSIYYSIFNYLDR